MTAADLPPAPRGEAPPPSEPRPSDEQPGLAALILFGRAVGQMTDPGAIQAAAGRALRDLLGAARVSCAECALDGAIEAAGARLAPGLSPTAPRLDLAELGLARGGSATPPPTDGGGPDGRIAWTWGPAEASSPPRAGLRIEIAGARAWTDGELALVEAIAGRTWSELARARAERELAGVRRDLGILRDLADLRAAEPAALDEALVTAAISLSGADGATLHAVEPATQEPVVLAGRGMSDELLAGVGQAGGSSAVAAALAGGRRVALDHADRSDGAPASGAAGFASSEATPLITRAGEVVGALSTCWRGPRPAGEHEAAFLDLLARQAADLVEARRVGHAAREAAADAAFCRRQAGEASRSRDDFLALLGHELRTPLAPILLWGRMLLGGRVPLADISRAIEAIVTSAESQSRLVDELLDLSRITAGRLSLTAEPTDVAAVARAAIEVVRPTAEAKRQTLRVDLDPALGAAWLDSRRFQQVLWNLLTNAVKFTPEGGAVSVRLWREGSSLVGQVADTGEGMSAELLARAFERFYPKSMDDDRSHGGLGVGLALCRELVQMHGGTIEARSPGPGLGSIFTLRIPLGTRPAHLAAPDPPVPRSERPLRHVGVLLVEDDGPTREVMQWVLERAGARVLAVSSAPQALEALAPPAGPSIDVIVCDLGLPGRGGHDLIQQIDVARRRRGEASIPACAVSAHVRSEDRQRALDAGFSRHLGKPITRDTLVDAVRELARARPDGEPLS